MPRSIVAKKISVPVDPKGTDVTAGPGQKPPSPQPMPKVAAPTIRRASKSVRVGMWNMSLKNGVARFCTNQKPGIVTLIAPPITKARLGYQVPNRSRNYWTLAGLDIHDRNRPGTNNRPEQSERI